MSLNWKLNENASVIVTMQSRIGSLEKNTILHSFLSPFIKPRFFKPIFGKRKKKHYNNNTYIAQFLLFWPPLVCFEVINFPLTTTWQGSAPITCTVKWIKTDRYAFHGLAYLSNHQKEEGLWCDCYNSGNWGKKIALLFGNEELFTRNLPERARHW